MTTPSVAYLVLAHEQPELFRRLCRRLAGPVFAHVDARVPLDLFAAGCPDNVRFLAERQASPRGGWSLTRAMIALLRTARQHRRFDFYQFLSGRDYPIKPAAAWLEYLRRHSGQSWLSSYPLRPGALLVENVQRLHFVDAIARARGLSRLMLRSLQAIARLLPPRRFPASLQPYRGSQWLTLCAETAEFVLHYLNSSAAAGYCEFFERVWGSDEIFFHSLILSHDEVRRCRNASLHYIDWSPTREDPAILVERDYPLLREDPAFFARKFCCVRSQVLLDRIDVELLTLPTPSG